MCKGSILPCIKKFLRQGIILSAVIYMLGVTKAKAEICFLPNGEECQSGLAINSTACKKWSDAERQKVCSTKNGYVSKSNVAAKEASGFNCEFAERTLGDVCCPGWYYCTEKNCRDRGFKKTQKETPAEAYLCTECTQGDITYYKCEARPCNYDEENPSFSTLEDKCDGNGKYCLAKYAECQEGYEWVADSSLRAGKQRCGKCQEAEIPQVRCAGVIKWKDQLSSGCVTCTLAGDVNGREFYCCQDIEEYPIPESLRDLTDGACHQYDGPVLSSGISPIYCYKRVEKDCGNDNQYNTSGPNGCYCRDYVYEFDAFPDVLNFDAAGKPIKTGDTVTVTSTRAHRNGSNKEFNKYEILENNVKAETGCQLLDDTKGNIKVSCRRNEKIGKDLSSEFVVRHVHTATTIHPELSKKITINVEGDKCLNGLAIEPEIECVNGTKGKKTEINSVSGSHPCYKCLNDTCPDDTWTKCQEDGKDCRPNQDGYEVQKTEYGNYCIRVKPCESGTILSNQRTSGEKCYEEAGHSGNDICWKHKDPLSECSAAKGEIWDEKICSCVGTSEPSTKSACFDEVWGEEKEGSWENGKIVGGNVYVAPDGKKTYKKVPENPCIEQGTKVYKAEYARNNYVFDFNRCVCQASQCPKTQGYYDNAPTGCYECQKETIMGRECLKCKTFDEAYGDHWEDSKMLGICWDVTTEKVAADRQTVCLKTKECTCPSTHPNTEKPKCFDEVMGMVNQNEYHIGGLTCYKDVIECVAGEKRDETTCKCKPSPNICPDGTFDSEEECEKGEGCFDCVKRSAKDDAKYGDLVCYERVEMLNHRTAEDWVTAKFCYDEASKKQSANKEACYQKSECVCPEGTSSEQPKCYDKYADSQLKKKEVKLDNGTVCYPTDEPKCDEGILEYYDYDKCECVTSGCIEGVPYEGIPGECRVCTFTGQNLIENGKEKGCWVCFGSAVEYSETKVESCFEKAEFNRFDKNQTLITTVPCYKKGKEKTVNAECLLRVVGDKIDNNAPSVAFKKIIRATTQCEVEGSETITKDIELPGTDSVAVSMLGCEGGKISFTDKIEYKGNNYICHVDKEYAPDCPQQCTDKCPKDTYWEDEIPNKDALGSVWINSWTDSGEKACGKICYKAKDIGCPDCVPEDKISGCKQCRFVMYSGTTAMYKCTDLNPVDSKSYTDEFKDKSTLTIKESGYGWTCKQVGILNESGISKNNSECCAPKACEGENVYAGSADKGEEINPNGCRVYVDEEEQCHHCALTGKMSGNYNCYTQYVDPVCEAYGKNAHPYQNEDEAKEGMGCNNVKYLGKPLFCRDFASCYKCEQDPCPDCVTEDEISGCEQCTFFGYSGSTAMYKCTDLNPVDPEKYADEFRNKSRLNIRLKAGWVCEQVGILKDENGVNRSTSECCAPKKCKQKDAYLGIATDSGSLYDPNGCREYVDDEERCHYCTIPGGLSGNNFCIVASVENKNVCAQYGNDAHSYANEDSAKIGMGCNNVEFLGKPGQSFCYNLTFCYKCNDPG